MRPQPALCDVKAVQQCRECRTEKPVAQEIGRKVHKDGRIGVLEPYPEKQMHRIIGGKQQQRCTHDAPGAQVVSENGLSRYSCQQKIKAEEQHQRQRNKKRMAVYRRFHDDMRIDFQVQSYSKISAYRFILPPIYDLYPPAELPGAPLWRTFTVFAVFRRLLPAAPTRFRFSTCKVRKHSQNQQLFIRIYYTGTGRL